MPIDVSGVVVSSLLLHSGQDILPLCAGASVDGCGFLKLI